MDAYLEDLAVIHECAYTHLAAGAGSLLTDLLPKTVSDVRTIVDLGCGGGTFAQLMCAAGYHVIGYDISAAMIDMARQRAPAATFHTGSFVDVEFPPCIAITAIGEIFNYLFDARNREAVLDAVIGRVHRALLPGGFLLFDVAGPTRAEALPEQTFANNPDWSVLVRTTTEGDLLTREITSYRRIDGHSRRSEEVHRLRLIDPASIAALLADVGFDVEEISTYGEQQLPAGLHGFLARKSAAVRGS